MKLESNKNNRPSSIIYRPSSGTRNPELDKRVEILYSCRENFTNQPFYAKQTQFWKSQNWPKLFFDKQIRDKWTFGDSENKPNSNPNKANNKQLSTINNENKAKQTQFQKGAFRN